MIQAVLFDLDGTFADTAPDLARAVNAMRAARNLPPIALEATRPVTSHGARGLLAAGFGMSPDHPDYAAMRAEFLDLYARDICVETRVFPGIAELLRRLEVRGLKWGIVTNKAERFAKPLIERLDPEQRCACVVGGDTASRMKPHPDPLLAAARLIDLAPGACVYVGDDRRDVDAGHAAGMRTIAVRYGYLNGSDPGTWGADAVVDTPEEVLAHL